MQNELFYAKLFMSPISHASTFLMGVLTSLAYLEFIKERSQEPAGNSASTRFFTLIKQNAPQRYFMYIIGLGCMVGAVLWQTPFSGGGSGASRIHKAAYAALAFPIYIFGLMLVLLPALVGRAQLFRFFYGSQSWTMPSQMATGLYYSVPMVALYYFMATQHQIQVTYYMFLYYFTGNLVFGIVLYGVLMPVDRSLYAGTHLKRDVKDAEASRFYRLRDYLENFKDDRLATIYDGMQSVADMQLRMTQNAVVDSQREASNLARTARLQPRAGHSDASQEVRVDSQGGVLAGQGLH